jgi:serine/threonine-protein kinase
MVGTLVGPYKLVRLLGQGGMGAVYEGVHQKQKAHVAIKLLHREHAQNSAQLTRFFNGRCGKIHRRKITLSEQLGKP